MRSLPALLLLAACGPGSARGPKPDPGPDALATLAVGGQYLDLSTGRHYFALPAETLGRTSRVEAEPHDPDAVVTLRWETATGELIEDGADEVLPLGADQRLVVTVDDASWMVTFPPAILPPVEVEGTPSERFYFLTPRDYTVDEIPAAYAQALLIVDGHGTPVWWRYTWTAAFDFRLAGDGSLTVNTKLEEDEQGLHSHQLDPHTGEILATWEPADAGWDTIRTDAHEHQLRADGSVLTTFTGNEAGDLSPWGGPVDGTFWHSGVRELAPDGSIVQQWTTEGKIDLDGLPAYVLDEAAEGRPWRYGHINSVQQLDEGILLSLRSPNQVALVDPASDTYLWRLGGSTSDLVFVDDSRGGFVGQHSARMFEPDRLTVFDNGTNFFEPATGDVRVVEYALDHDAGTATQVWEYVLDGAGGVEFAGLVQRHADGATTIGWGSLQTQNGDRSPSVTELDSDRSWRCHLRLPAGMYTYRAYAFDGDPITGDWDFPGFP